MNSFAKSLLNVIPHGLSTPSCLLNTISRNVPSGDNLCMSCESPDKINIGGHRKAIILNTDGSRVREIATDSINFNLLHNERNVQLLLRQDRRLCCINLHGHKKYKNSSFTKNIKILHQQNIKILHLPKI
jgi:hypothetical protein